MLRKWFILRDSKSEDGNGKQQQQQQTGDTPQGDRSGESGEDGQGEGEGQGQSEGEGDGQGEGGEGQDQEPVSGKDDPLIATLLRDMKGEEDVPPVQRVPEEDPGQQQQQQQAQTGDDTPDDKKPDGQQQQQQQQQAQPKRKKKVVVDVDDADLSPPPPTQQAAAPEQTPAPAQPQQPDPDAAYIATLTEEQRDELAEAELAEKMFGDRYKGRKQQLLQWYRDFDSKVQKLVESDPERKLDESDPDFQKLLRTKPRIEPVHYKAIQRKLGEEAAAARVKQELAPQLEEVRKRQEEIEYRPKVEKVTKSFQDGIGNIFEEDPRSPMAGVVKVFKEKGPEAAVQDFPLEVEIYQEEIGRSKKMVSEYLMFARGLREFNQADPTHVGLVRFITDRENEFLQHGGEALTRTIDGVKKTFLPRAQLLELRRKDPEKAKLHWTFGHRDVLEMLAYQTKIDIETRIREEEERAKRRGFERRKPATSATPQKEDKKEPEEINPPVATPKIAKGGTKPKSKGAQQPAGEPINVVETLRYKDI